MSLFPPGDREEIWARINLAWDFTGPLPVPRFAPTCPSCGAVEMHARLWRFHERNPAEAGRFAHRASISLKCATCGLIHTYGLALPENVFYTLTQGARERTVHWREAQRILDEG